VLFVGLLLVGSAASAVVSRILPAASVRAIGRPSFSEIDSCAPIHHCHRPDFYDSQLRSLGLSARQEALVCP
jgi:hypothetical protein